MYGGAEGSGARGETATALWTRESLAPRSAESRVVEIRKAALLCSGFTALSRLALPSGFRPCSAGMIRQGCAQTLGRVQAPWANVAASEIAIRGAQA